MPWAFPPACSLAKRLPLFTFRSIRAVNSSENTVIVAVVKRYVQVHATLFLSALSSPFSPCLYKWLIIRSIVRDRGPDSAGVCRPAAACHLEQSSLNKHLS